MYLEHTFDNLPRQALLDRSVETGPSHIRPPTVSGARRAATPWHLRLQRFAYSRPALSTGNRRSRRSWQERRLFR